MKLVQIISSHDENLRIGGYLIDNNSNISDCDGFFQLSQSNSKIIKRYDIENSYENDFDSFVSHLKDLKDFFEDNNYTTILRVYSNSVGLYNIPVEYEYSLVNRF